MRPRWQVERRGLCVIFTLAVASALIPSLTDTVVAQDTSKAAVCESFQEIMLRLLQHAARLKEAQTTYQGELEGEYLGLQDTAAAATRAAARPDIPQARKDQLVAYVKALLVAIQETRANLRQVIQQQTKIGQQILHLRDLEAQTCAPASTATTQPPKPAGSSAPQSGAVGPHLVLVDVTDNVDSVAHGDPGWQTHYQGYNRQGNSLVFVPDRNDVAGYGSMRVEWSLPKVMFSGAAYRITLSGSCINVPRGGAGVNLSAAPHPIFGAQPPQAGIFVGRGGDGSLRCDNQGQEIALTPKIGAAARDTSYNIEVRVGGIAITYHYVLQ